jgi:MFS family permease
VYAGALADRFDIRRVIQIGMVIFMGVSVAWGLLFLSGALQMWHAMALLIIHGLAGVLWTPTTQIFLHEIVGAEQLPSAVRLNATARYLGMLLGPAVGSGFLLVFGPAHGILMNALIYAPMVLWLWKAPYGPKFRKEPPPPRAVRGFADIIATFRNVAGDHTLLSMILLAGCASFFIGSAYQAQMPAFANDLGHGNAGVAYSALLAADAAGALIAGLVLESRGLLPPNPRTAFILGALWCCALASFALTNIYSLALPLLFAAGFLELSFMSMSQTLVQLNAPAPIRGRVIGVFSMASLGMRTFSGLTVGLLGGWIGVHASLAGSAIALLGAVILIFLLSFRAPTASA